MKSYRFLRLTSVVLCGLLAPKVEAQEFDPMEICRGKPDDATVMNPLSCDSFLLCQNSMPVGTGRCPSGMLFNAQQDMCDFPENVKCGSVPLPPDFEQSSTVTSETTLTDEEEKTTAIPSTTHSCPAVDDPVVPMYLPQVDDCASYILCYHGNPLLMQCPNGLEWNTASSICDLPENAKCQAIYQDPYGCPETGSEVLAHPTNCKKFIFCLNGISREQVCQMFKHFDPVAKECEYQCDCVISNVTEHVQNVHMIARSPRPLVVPKKTRKHLCGPS